MTLTKEQQQAVERGEVVPATFDQTDCVVLRKDVYERMQSVLSDEWSDDDLRSLLARSAEANGWNEPEMDAYDHYDQAKQCP